MEVLESRLSEKVIAIKRRTLGFCGKVSFKSEEDIARVLNQLKIYQSMHEATEAVRSFPDVLELEYPGNPAGQAGPDSLRIIRFKNPIIASDPAYKVEKRYSTRF